MREQGELVTDFSGRMDYCELQKLFDALMPFGEYRCYWKSHFLSGLSDEVIDTILQGNRYGFSRRVADGKRRIGLSAGEVLTV